MIRTYFIFCLPGSRYCKVLLVSFLGAGCRVYFLSAVHIEQIWISLQVHWFCTLTSLLLSIFNNAYYETPESYLIFSFISHSPFWGVSDQSWVCVSLTSHWTLPISPSKSDESWLRLPWDGSSGSYFLVKVGHQHTLPCCPRVRLYAQLPVSQYQEGGKQGGVEAQHVGFNYLPSGEQTPPWQKEEHHCFYWTGDERSESCCLLPCRVGRKSRKLALYSALLKSQG